MEPTNHPFRKETWSSKPPFLGSMLIFQGVWISSSRCLTTYRRYGNIDNPDQRIAQDIGSADGRTNSGCQRMENELGVLEVWEDDMKKITTYEFWLSEESNEVTRSLGFLLLKIWISQIGWAVLKVTFLPLANLANLIILGLGFTASAQPDSIRWAGELGSYVRGNIWQHLTDQANAINLRHEYMLTGHSPTEHDMFVQGMGHIWVFFGCAVWKNMF